MVGMLNADLGMLSALGMLNLGMLDAGLGMLSASGMRDFPFTFCECTPLNVEISFCGGKPLCVNFFFFLHF